MSVGAAISLSFQPRSRDACKHSHEHIANGNWPADSAVVHHSVTPSLHPDNGAERERMPSPEKPRTPARSHEERIETRTSLHVRLVQHVTEPSKVVARRTGASPDTVDLHRQGSVPQSWAQLIAYCRAYPAFALEVVELMGLDLDQDRQSYAIFLQLQKQVRGEQ